MANLRPVAPVSKPTQCLRGCSETSCGPVTQAPGTSREEPRLLARAKGSPVVAAAQMETRPLIAMQEVERNYDMGGERIAALAGEAQPCDPVTVSEHLQRLGKLNDAGGLAYLGTLKGVVAQ